MWYMSPSIFQERPPIMNILSPRAPAASVPKLKSQDEDLHQLIAANKVLINLTKAPKGLLRDNRRLDVQMRDEDLVSLLANAFGDNYLVCTVIAATARTDGTTHRSSCWIVFTVNTLPSLLHNRSWTMLHAPTHNILSHVAFIYQGGCFHCPVRWLTGLFPCFVFGSSETIKKQTR